VAVEMASSHPLKRVLAMPEIRQKLPEDARSFVNDVMVVRKLGDKTGKQLLNFSRVARSLPRWFHRRAALVARCLTAGSDLTMGACSPGSWHRAPASSS